MANSQSLRPTQGPDTKPTTNLTDEQRRALQQERIRERARIFELTPSALEQHLRSRRNFGDEAVSGGGSDLGEGSGNEADDWDWDDIDPDDPDALGGEDDWGLPSALLNEPEAGVCSAVLQRSDIYPLYVVPRGEQDWQCRFRAPPWMREVPRESSGILDRLDGFLRAVSEWLESEKQPFLREPAAGTFALGETLTGAGLVVTQKGLLERVYAFRNKPPVGVAHTAKTPPINEKDMSRLLQGDKVWILWPKTCLPLSALFTSDFTLAWGVARCLELAPAEKWPESFQKMARTRKAATVGIAVQTLQERLNAASQLTGIGPDALLAAVRAGEI